MSVATPLPPVADSESTGPTLVELVKSQYDELVTIIEQIGIEITTENFTLNFDLEQLESLTQLVSTNLILNQEKNTEMLSSLEATNTQFMIQSHNDNNQMHTLVTELGLSNHNDLDNFASTNHIDLRTINDTLGKIWTLEHAETEALSNKFFTILGEIDAVLDTINGVINTMQAVQGALQTYFTVGQNGILENLLVEQTTTNALLRTFIEGFDAKVIEAVMAATWEVETEEVIGTEMLFDACVYDPLGFGPINCDGLEASTMVLNAVKMQGI